jgi:hypothetical protein
MSGHWPPEWDDPEEEFPEGADQADTKAEARLSEVSAYLASVPAPVLPDAIEARISAALAAEAGARAEHTAPADSAPADSAPAGSAPADGARNLGPAPARPRVRRHRGGDGFRRRFRVRPQVVGGSLVTCLLLALLGFALSHASFSSSSSSGAAAGSAAEPAAGEASSAASSSAAGPIAAPSGVAPGAEHTVSTFTVTVSGTKYQQATLAAQVRAKLAVNGGQNTFGTVPAASASATSAAAPSQALRGCVAHLTNGLPPRLVDRATYEGEPAYIIASSSRVWVVEPGCTAAKTEVVASVPLAS